MNNDIGEPDFYQQGFSKKVAWRVDAVTQAEELGGPWIVDKGIPDRKKSTAASFEGTNVKSFVPLGN